jgi:hypothetical protein
MNKNIFRFCLILFISIISISVVNALGVAPAREIVEYNSDLNYNSNILIVNDMAKPLKVSINVEGKLANYVTLNNVLLDFKEGEKEKIVEYNIRIPSDVVDPGNNDISFIVTELPSEEVEGTYVGARISLISTARVVVPYPGKYAETDLRIYEGDADGKTVFLISVKNKGTNKIDSAKGVIEIKSPTNKLIGVFETDVVSVDPGKIKELLIVWDALVNPGKYTANVVLEYDGKSTETVEVFSVGDYKIEIYKLEVSDFVLGDIAKFEIDIRNLWTDVIDEVYAQIEIYDSFGEIVGEFKTSSIVLDSRKSSKLIGYWDTSGIDSGEYNTKVFLHYDDKILERNVETKISTENIETTMMATGKAIALSGVDYKFNSVFMIGLFVLVVINLFWFLYFKRRKPN